LLNPFVASSFSGVEAVADSKCEQRSLGGALRGTPVSALLYFCDSSAEVVLDAPIVEDVWLEAGDPQRSTAIYCIACGGWPSTRHNQQHSKQYSKIVIRDSVVVNNTAAQVRGVSMH
jgi:hypothetical protein